MSTAAKNQHEVPLGSSSPIKSRQSVRKRVAAAAQPIPRLPTSPTPTSHTTPRRMINPHLIYRDYAHYKPKGPVSMGMRIRNFVTILFMISFPLSIFILPIWWHTPTYPRVVVAVTTTSKHLPLLQPTLQALLVTKQPSSFSPDMVYLILPKSDPIEDGTLAHLLPDINIAGIGSSDTQKIQILYTNKKYGHTITSGALAAVDQEQRLASLNMDAAAEDDEQKAEDVAAATSGSVLEERGEIDGSETRIIVFDDRHWQHDHPPSLRLLLQTLVEASQDYPNAVLSGVGGHWRSHFRQIKRVVSAGTTTSITSSSSSWLDKFPNVFVHTVERRASPPVELLESSTTGIIFRVGVMTPAIMKSFQDHLNLLEKEVSAGSVDPIIFEPDAGDVVWSGLLEAHNMTRRIVPTDRVGVVVAARNSSRSGETAPSSAKSTGSSHTTPSRRHWMTAAFQLQYQWSIWKEYTFWDWSTLSERQKEAMECEGKFEPDCSSTGGDGGTDDGHEEEEDQGGECRPSPQHCGDATPFGPVLAELSNKS